MSGPAALSIGGVLGELRGEFPDISISKLRFLESEGLVEPERSPSGYRRYTRADVDRLRWVLTAQRDQYLPLRVIRAHLEALDQAGAARADPPTADAPSADPPTADLPPADPPTADAPSADPQPAGPRPERGDVRAAAGPDLGAPGTPPGGGEALDQPGPGLPSAADFARPDTDVRLSRADLVAATGLDPAQLEELERYGLLAPLPGSGLYDGDAFLVAKTVAELARFGIEARHLRPFRSAADRELGLLEQVLSPLSRRGSARDPDAAVRAEQAGRELAALTVRLHTALVRSGLHRGQVPGSTRPPARV